MTTRLLRALVLVVVGAVLLTGCDFSVYSLPLPGGAKVGDDPLKVKVEFRDVLDLVPQASVKVDDVSVGKVSAIKVADNHAEVSLELRRSVKLPENAVAKIRQTSLLGEKFVSLSPPSSGATGRLRSGDTIPLSRSGRNPEVEEVLGALSLLLNGGGVAQLKTISVELNKALGGRETDVRSVLSRINELTGQLDDHKDEIVAAIQSLDRLAIALNKQKSSIVLALDQLPRAIASINRQRDDLVTMLRALQRLSGIGTKVILASKTATVDSLQALAPTLTKLAETGQDLPKALQVFLTYPFVDAVVGTNPAQARNLHVGDYTNLDIKLDVDLSGFDQICSILPQLKDLPVNVCDNPALEACVKSIDATKLIGSPAEVLANIVAQCGQVLQTAVCPALSGGPLGGALGDLGDALDDLCKGVNTEIPKLPLNVPSLSALTKCLTSGKPLGAACDKLNPLSLVQRCAKTNKKNKPAGYYSETCRVYRAANLGIVKGGDLGKLPIVGGGGSGSGSGGGGGGGGLPGLPDLGLPRAATGASTDRAGSSAVRRGAAPDSDLAGMLAWGMVQR